MTPLTPKEFRDIFPSFRTAPDELVAEILSASARQAFTSGMLVYSEGDSCSAIAFLLSGVIRVYKMGSTGREITLYEIERGETCILNASCILSSFTYPAHAVSTEAGEMLLIPSSEFTRLVNTYAEMRNFVFSILNQRLVTVMQLVEEVAFGKVDRRLVEYLTEKAEGNALHATHQKIADDLGTSREVVSRLLKDLERKGKVSISRNLVRLLS